MPLRGRNTASKRLTILSGTQPNPHPLRRRFSDSKPIAMLYSLRIPCKVTIHACLVTAKGRPYHFSILFCSVRLIQAFAHSRLPMVNRATGACTIYASRILPLLARESINLGDLVSKLSLARAPTICASHLLSFLFLSVHLVAVNAQRSISELYAPLLELLQYMSTAHCTASLCGHVLSGLSVLLGVNAGPKRCYYHGTHCDPNSRIALEPLRSTCRPIC